jgi:lipopolysaccharide export system protein LptA
MKKILLTAIAAAFLATSAFAQAPVEKPAKPSTKAPVATKFAGSIVKADATTLTLKVKTKEEAFMLTADTKITQGTKTLTAADLKAGENATVTYTKAGDMMTATKIVVATPKPAPVKKAAK